MLCVASVTSSFGAAVSRETAGRAAHRWLTRSVDMMGAAAGQPGVVTTHADDAGQSLFHVVHLAPAGFVVVAADDEVEPVLAFSTASPFLAQAGMPLFDLLRHDAAARLQSVRRHGRIRTLAGSSRLTDAQTKWRRLLAADGDTGAVGVRSAGIADVSDVWVAPMVRSQWDQVRAEVPLDPPATGTRPIYIYNYYTPGPALGSPYNYPAGCSAVAWAQIMRFHEWPKTIGNATYVVTVDGYYYRVPLMGGDGWGGAYDWTNMPLVPGADVTLEQIQAIAALVFDAGVGTGADYNYFGTYATTTPQHIKEVFHYAEAKSCVPQPGSSDLTDLMKAVRTSLDAGLPANLNIFTTTRIGHSLVIDGYGNQAGTRYHHLNLGWGGHSDAWYNFPPVDVFFDNGEAQSFSRIDSLTYNIDPQVAGEMITGRVADQDGRPVGGVTVTLNTTPARAVTSNPRGIYAFKGLSPATSYALSAAADGYLVTAEQATVTVGNAATERYTTPNRIVDFRAQPLNVAVASPTGLGLGAAVALSVPTSAAQPVAWLRNGARLPDTASFTLALPELRPAHAGLYALTLSLDPHTVQSGLAILGVESTEKVAGAGHEVLSNVTLPGNGNTFDQVLLEGAAATITADPGQITRLSYIDLDDDIVQVEFSGPGTLTLTLDDPTGPALPANYDQRVQYMKGHASIVITGATQDSHLAVFSVGRVTALNPTLFKPDVNYDGIADLAFIAIASRDGKFGGVRTANAHFFASRGVTGLYAPGVALTGPLYLGDVTAFDEAKPMIRVGSAAEVRITGGDLYQDNGQPVRVSGLTAVAFSDGADSHGKRLPAQANRGVLWENGTDVTAQLAIHPAATAPAR